MIDILLQQTLDDGDVLYRNGDLAYDFTYRTAVYLSLFGGNREDSGAQNSNKQFWGNYLSDNDKYISETQYLLQDMPLIPSNLRLFEDAAQRDMQWLLDDNLCDSITVNATIPAVNTVLLIVTIDGLELNFTFEKTYGNANN